LKLQLTEPGHLRTIDLNPTDPIVRHKVRLGETHVYVIGFNLGRPGQKSRWRIAGRKTNYKSAEAALDALQKEEDEREIPSCSANAHFGHYHRFGTNSVD
jgi:hypothetical protein